MACKCRFSCKYTILPFSILILSLSQLYFQYSSFMTKRNQNLEEQDKRHQLYTLNFIFGKRYEFNLGEIDNYFNDNALMKIPQLKDLVEKGFNKWNEKREKKLDLKLYEIFYLIIYDLIFIIFLYLFIFKSFKAGIIKIIIQLLKFGFTMIRFKKKHGNICLCKIIYNHYESNTYLRGLEFFDAEGCEISEFLCNLVIVLDIIWLIIIKRDASKNDNNLPETEFIIKKQILTDENRVDYNEEGQGTIKLTEEKIYSNENNQESDEDKDKDENDNINNNDDENDNQNENEKDDEEINNNKYDEDNENINNIKDEDDDQENNCESNENNYNNYQNPEVNNSLNDNKEKEEEENNEEEEGIDENQETK